MEYVEGKTLEDILIENQGRLPDELMVLNWAGADMQGFIFPEHTEPEADSIP